jgi:hypothetical protein
LFHEVELGLKVTLGAIESTLLIGEVQVVVFPALSDIVTVQVSPCELPVVQDPPETLIPEPPASVDPDRVKL